MQGLPMCGAWLGPLEEAVNGGEVVSGKVDNGLASRGSLRMERSRGRLRER